MRTAIIYYSEQNDIVDSIAKQIVDKIGKADLIDAQKETVFHGYHYTQIVFGSPECHGTIAPPIREFIQKNKDEFFLMSFAAFMCRKRLHWGDCFKELRELVGPLKAEMTFTGKQDDRVDAFCKKLMG